MELYEVKEEKTLCEKCKFKNECKRSPKDAKHIKNIVLACGEFEGVTKNE